MRVRVCVCVCVCVWVLYVCVRDYRAPKKDEEARPSPETSPPAFNRLQQSKQKKNKHKQKMEEGEESREPLLAKTSPSVGQKDVKNTETSVKPVKPDSEEEKTPLPMARLMVICLL